MPKFTYTDRGLQILITRGPHNCKFCSTYFAFICVVRQSITYEYTNDK
jgi:hypothetical protein